MKKRLLSIVLALTMVVPVCAMPQAEAYSTGTAELPTVVSVGFNHCGLISEDGSLWMWGENYDAQLGDGTETGRWKPVKIMTDVKSIALGEDNTAAIKKDGSLWIWGDCSSFTDSDDWIYDSPVKIAENVAAVSFGRDGLLVVKKDGSLWAYGEDKQPQKIMDDVQSVAASAYTSAAIKKDGSLWMWGYNCCVELGTVSVRDVTSPIKVMDDVESVAVGYHHSAAIKEDGSLWMWGDNSYGELAHDPENDCLPPRKVMDAVESVALGIYSSAAIKKDGSLWMWGENNYGNLGNGTLEDRDYPVKIMENVASVSVSTNSSAAIKKDGSVWVWGHCNYLGLGEDYPGYKPMEYYGEIYYNHIDVPTRLTGFTASAATKPQCTITLNLNGGTGTTKITCDKNGTITPPNNPSRDGYFFAGWYKDKACTKPWNFDTDKVTGNCTLYAKWEPKSTTTVTAEPSTQKVEIDGKKIILNSYVLRNDQGYPVNFVKLRDIAFLLDGTEANFNVDWRNNAIRLDARQPYTTPNGAEMTVPTVAAAPAKTSLTPVLTGGVTAPLEAFLLTDKNGGGHNYFKLRDIGKVAGFNVEWDGARGIIVVTTTEDYIG